MEYISTVQAIIVLYKTKIPESKSYITLQKSLSDNKQKIDLIIYDNSPAYNSDYGDINSSFFNITYIPDYDNSGVSKAYNTAFNIAKDTGKKYLLLLDQDTDIPVNFIHELINSINLGYDLIFPFLISNNQVISPCNFRFGRGSVLKKKHFCPGLHNLKNINFLNSGAIVSLEVFEKAGGYDLRLPLYYSDFNFFNRVKKITDTYYSMNVNCYHEMSSNDTSDLEKFNFRFKCYCEGAIKCYDNIGGKLIMLFNIFARTLILSLKLKTTLLIKTSIKTVYDNFGN